MISELLDRRNQAIEAFSRDTYFVNQYRGSVLSIEYETILTISLQLIKNNRKIITFIQIFKIFNYFI